MIVEKYKTWINFLVMVVCSWLCYFGFIVIVHYGVTFNSVATMSTVFFSGKFYLNFLLIVVTCGVIDLATYTYNTLFAKNLAGTLMVLVKERGSLNDRVDLPELIDNALKKYDIYKQDDKQKDMIAEPNVIEVSHVGPINEENKPNVDGIYKNKAHHFDKVCNNRLDDIYPEEVKVSSRGGIERSPRTSFV
jgi:hypothetical protein